MGGIGGGGQSGGKQGQDPDLEPAAQPSVSEEVVWKARAVRAEARVAELEERIAAFESELNRMRAEFDATEKKRQIELELSLAEAIDVETAALLIERAIEGAAEPDIAAAVAELKQTKPFLFRSSSAGSVMSGHIATNSRDVLGDLADEAKQTGDRAALLRYLRARRGA
ncbi:MAG: hypothetical protein D6695_08110 [Planctomycetota bacterium]|nr:MAG: hypothetical protein D6695_08110 [Planctomycetota bacterium]